MWIIQLKFHASPIVWMATCGPLKQPNIGYRTNTEHGVKVGNGRRRNRPDVSASSDPAAVLLFGRVVQSDSRFLPQVVVG
jgi:hypothetical protein